MKILELNGFVKYFFGLLLDKSVSVLLVLKCFQYSNLMQIDSLTFQQGF
jgi:hypothetical protein